MDDGHKKTLDDVRGFSEPQRFSRARCEASWPGWPGWLKENSNVNIRKNIQIYEPSCRRRRIFFYGAVQQQYYVIFIYYIYIIYYDVSSDFDFSEIKKIKI